jgi:hypothetical protein
VITEQAKYEQVWADGRYGNYSPGEAMLPLFRRWVRRKGTLIDIGCGCARATKQLQDDGWKVVGMDFVDARETDITFCQHDITRPFIGSADMGYCCDVMEHIEPEYVNKVLENIMSSVERCFFTIHFGEDQFGALIGHPLHLTVKPFTWWRDKLSEHGTLLQARDLLGMGAYLVRR